MAEHLDKTGLTSYDEKIKKYFSKRIDEAKNVSVDEPHLMLKVKVGNKTYILNGLSELVPPVTPTADLRAGEYDGSQNIKLYSTTGASIRYTINGGVPILSSPLYNNVLVIEQDPLHIYIDRTLRAKAWLNGEESKELILSFRIYRKVAKPEITVNGDEYDTSRTITIKCETAGASILVSKDSGISYENINQWVADSNIPANTIKIKAAINGWKDSDIISNGQIMVGKLKMYYGIMTDIPSSINDIQNLTGVKSQTLSTSKTSSSSKYKFQMNGHRAVFAFPSSVATQLSAIYDQNDFNQIGGFTKITSIPNYIVYYKTDLAYDTDTYNFVK